ncbi:MAG: hypothetical protein ACOX69_00875 [Coriobacteriales bacterium]|jgi:leader peptidase (prepilin peptidase)/N-methyltransferase
MPSAIYIAYAAAAFAGAALVAPQLARLLLSRREQPLSPIKPLARLALAALSTAGACGMLWEHDALATALLLAGLIIMEALVICDIRARILPWEGCLMLGVLGVLLRLLDGGLLTSIALAALVFAALFGSSVLVSHGKSRALGWGDLRLIPALVLIGGPAGTICGGLACAVAACAHALVCLVAQRGSASDAFPLGPSLLVWFLVVALC